jgi:hypothetical protein
MSKKKASKGQESNQQHGRRSRRRSLGIVALILCLGMTSLLLAQWRGMRSSLGPLAPLPTPTPTLQLSKEYIYAGGKLIATEEPNNGGGSSPLSPPSSLIATGTSSTQINLTWTAATGGTVDHYQVERMQSLSSGFAVVAPTVSATSYNETVNAGSAYIYRVRAVDSSNNLTNYSNLDLATALTFTDDPLVAGTTTIKAQHLTELRQAVNAVHVLAGLGDITWTNPSPAGVAIKAVHVQEMRTNLDQALNALSLPVQSYTDPALSSALSIKRVHFDELRQRVK